MVSNETPSGDDPRAFSSPESANNSSQAALKSPRDSDSTLTEESFEDADDFDADAVDLSALVPQSKKEKGKKKSIQESKLITSQKRTTADKGVQVHKEDITTATKTDRAKMPPPPTPQRSSRQPVPGDTRSPQAPGRISSPQVFSPLSQGVKRAIQAQVGGSPQGQLQEGSFIARTPQHLVVTPHARGTHTESPLSNLPGTGGASTDTNVAPTASPPSPAADADPRAPTGISNQASALTTPGPDNETPEQWNQHHLREAAAAAAWCAAQARDIEASGPPSGTSAYLIRDYGEVPISLIARRNTTSTNPCEHGCGMPGGEHAVDCPALMATRPE